MNTETSEDCEHEDHHHDRSLVHEAEETALAPPKGMAARFAIWLIRGYQRFISPFTPPACRYTPTCSQYTLIAVQKYGMVRGCWMGMKRISRCHPLHEGGYDPVP